MSDLVSNLPIIDPKLWIENIKEELITIYEKEDPIVVLERFEETLQYQINEFESDIIWRVLYHKNRKELLSNLRTYKQEIQELLESMDNSSEEP